MTMKLMTKEIRNRIRMGLGIERDLSFRPTPLSKIKSGEVR
jgi:hypothetical protein